MSDVRLLIEVIGVQDMVGAVKITDQYYSSIGRLDNALKKKRITEEEHTRGVQQLNAQLRRTVTAYQSAAQGVKSHETAVKSGTIANDRYNNSLGRTGKRANRLGVMMQQTGYQAGDFFVQIQSGQHVMVALGQQLTQLVGTMGMLSKTMKFVTLFAGLGVAIPIITGIAGAWMRTRDAAKEAKDGIKTLEDQIKSAQEATQGMADEIERLNRGLENGSELAFSRGISEAMQAVADAEAALATARENSRGDRAGANVANAQQELDIAKELLRTREMDLLRAKRMREVLAAMRAEEEAVKDRNEAVAAIRESAEASLLIQQNRALLAKAELTSAEALADAQEDIFRQALATEGVLGNNANEIVRAWREANNLEAEITAVADAAKAAADATKDYVNEVVKGLEDTEDLREELGDAVFEALRLAGVDMAKPISEAELAAARLAAQLGVALSVAQDIQLTQLSLANRNEVYSGRGSVGMPSGPSNEGVFTPSQDTIDAADILLGLKDPPAPSRGSSGSSGPTLEEQYADAKDAVDSLRASYDEQYAVSLKVAEATTKINDAIRLGVYTAEEGALALEEYRKSVENLESPMMKIAATARDALGDAFMAVVEGSKSASDAFKDMARAIIKQAFDMLVIQPILDNIFGSLGGGKGRGNGILGSIFSIFQANGGAWNKGVQMFADGGVVSAPTAFAHSGGLGVMGEAGPEAIMPLKRGANGKLGVQMEGGGGAVVINQSFNFAANGDDSVKRIIAQAAPSIANMTKRSIIDDRRRGGQMKNAFG